MSFSPQVWLIGFRKVRVALERGEAALDSIPNEWIRSNEGRGVDVNTILNGRLDSAKQ